MTRIPPWALLTLQPEVIRELVRAALAEDVGERDVTTEATVPAEARASAAFVAKQDLVVAGLAGSAPATMLKPRIKVGESLAGRVVAEGAAIIGPLDALIGMAPEHLAADRALGYTHFMGLPLRFGERLIRALTFRARRPFSRRDQDVAEAFAGQAAVAIEHARLYREASQQAERMRALAEAIGEARLQAYAAWTIGRVHTVMGDAELAIEACRRAVELAADGRLPDAGDDGAVLRELGHAGAPSTTTKLGIENPPGPGSKPTATAMSMATSSGSHPRRRPGTRTPGWSANSTHTIT